MTKFTLTNTQRVEGIIKGLKETRLMRCLRGWAACRSLLSNLPRRILGVRLPGIPPLCRGRLVESVVILARAIWRTRCQRGHIFPVTTGIRMRGPRHRPGRRRMPDRRHIGMPNSRANGAGGSDAAGDPGRAPLGANSALHGGAPQECSAKAGFGIRPGSIWTKEPAPAGEPVEEGMGAAGGVGADQCLPAPPQVCRQLGQGELGGFDVVARGVGSRVAWPQQRGHRLSGTGLAVRQLRACKIRPSLAPGRHPYYGWSQLTVQRQLCPWRRARPPTALKTVPQGAGVVSSGPRG